MLMATQTKFLAFTVSGTLLMFVGMFSPSLGIHYPLQTILLFVALILIATGVWLSKRLKKEHQQVDASPRNLSRKQRILIFILMIAIAGVVTVSAPFWLPLTTPDLPPYILWGVPYGSFPFLVALFWYLTFKKSRGPF